MIRPLPPPPDLPEFEDGSVVLNCGAWQGWVRTRYGLPPLYADEEGTGREGMK